MNSPKKLLRAVCFGSLPHSDGQDLDDLTAVQVVDGIVVLVENAKARALMIILVRVPEDVHRVEGLASDGTPVSLGVLDGWNLLGSQLINLFPTFSIFTYSSTRVRTRNRPAGLGDPNPLSGRDSVDRVAGVLDGLPEDVRSVSNGGVLEVGISAMYVSLRGLGHSSTLVDSPIHANEIRSLDHSSICAINPRIPSIHMADLSLHANGSDHASNIVDLVRKRVRIGVLAVKVLAAYGNSEDPIFAMS